MAYQSPIPIRVKRPNPFAVFLSDIPETSSAEIDNAREQAARELAQKSRPALDFASIFSKGAIGGLQTVPDLLLGPSSAPSQYMRGLSDTWSALESPQYKAQQAIQAQEFNALGPDASLLDKGLLAGKHALSDPLGTAAMAAGNLAPFALGGAAGLPAKAGAMVVSGIMGGGAVRGGIYDAIQQAPDNALMADDRYAKMRKVMPEDEAKARLGEIASSIEESGGKTALGVATGIASGAFGAEAATMKLGSAAARNELIREELQKAAAGGVVKNFLKGAAEEAVSEVPEEGSQQYLSNVGAAAGGAKIDPWQNVAESAVQAGIAGALGGGFSHSLSNLNAKFNLAAMDRAENARARAEGKPETVAARPIIEPKPPVNGEIGEGPIDEEELSPEQIAATRVRGPLDDEIEVAREQAAKEVSQGLGSVANVLPEPAEGGQVLLPGNSPSAAPTSVDVAPVAAEASKATETVNPLVGAEQNLAAVEAQPSVESGNVRPDGTIEPIRRLREQIKQAVQPRTEPTVADVPAAADAVDSPVVDTQLPTTLPAPANDVVSGAVSAPAAEGVNVNVAAPEAPINAREVSVHEGTVAQEKPPVKVIGGNVRGGDTLLVGDKIATAHSHPFKGMVNVSFEDGTVKRVKLSEVKKIEPPPAEENQLEVVPEPSPKNHFEILKELRSAIPESATNKAEFDKAALEYQKNPTPDNLGAVLRQAKKAGLEPWAPGEAFATAVDALKAGQDAFQAVRNRGISEASAKAVVKKAQAYMARMAKTEDVDVESQLRASIEAAKKNKPTFSRSAELSPEEFAQQQMDEYHRSFEEDMATKKLRRQEQADSLVQPGSLAEKASNAFKSLKGLMNRAKAAVSDASSAISSRVNTITPADSEEIKQNWNGVNDENRAEPWDKGVANAQKVEGTKFKVADFEGDVDPSVVTGLTRLKPLADSISSVAARVANIAGLKTGTFAGFSPNGNFAGVTWRGRIWLNPLKHLGFTDNAAKMASSLVKTIVHEMIHTNGFGPHDAKFHAEFERVMAQIQPLIKGMEFEIGRTLDKETIKRLRGLNGTAEKGWSNAREKGRDAAMARRQSDSSVSGVQTETERNGNLPPPDSERQSGSRASEGTGGKAEGMESASESGRANEAAGGKPEGKPADVLKPEFAREADSEELELPKVTDRQRLVYEFVNKYARIGEMMKAVEEYTGKKADVDLEEAAIAVSPQTASKLRELRDYHLEPLKKILGESKISIPDAESYIHSKAAGEDVSEQESGDKAEAYKAIDEAVLRIINLGNAAADRSGLKAGKTVVDPEGPASGIIQRAIDRTQKLIVKSAENTFRRQVAEFLAKNISPDWAINPKNQEGGHTISFQIDGKRQRMWFKDKILASQIESLSDGETSWFMNKVRQGTRVFANVNTRLNPVFPVKNFIRDIFFGLGKVYVDDGSENMMKVLRGVPEAFKQMVAHARDPIASKGSLAHEMFAKGGMPEWFGLPSEEKIRAELEADIKEFDGSKQGKAWVPFKRAWNALRIMSEASEGATRLAYFKVLKESGVPIQEAIRKTRGVTGDFQRHGTNKNMRYAYAFFNSSIQGADAMAKLTKELRDGNPRARNLAVFLVGMGMAQALLGMGAGDNDKDGQNDYEQLPEYLKNSNLILPVPGHPIAIPLPYGLNVPIVAGMGIMRSMFSDEPDRHAKAAMNLWQATAKSFNPMGDEASLLQMVSPTLLDPLAQSSENIDSLGRKIVRDRYQGEENLPDSAIVSRKDSEFAKAVSSAANKLTGGSKVKPGLADVSPATIDNTVSWAGGSMLRFMKDLGAAKLVGGKWTGNIPIYNDFIKTPKSYFYTGRFWDQLEEIRSLKDSARQLDENARKEQLIELGLDPDRVESISRAELRKGVKLSSERSDKLSKEVQQIYGKRAKLLPMYEELRKQISALNQSGDPDAEARVEALVKAANRKYIEATR